MNERDLGHTDEGLIYLTGESKAPTNNPIMTTWGLFYVGLVVDPRTHTIRDAQCSATLEITRTFVHDLLVGRSLIETDSIIDAINARYHGSSQRALSASVRSAASKYRELLDGAQ